MISYTYLRNKKKVQVTAGTPMQAAAVALGDCLKEKDFPSVLSLKEVESGIIRMYRLKVEESDGVLTMQLRYLK